MTFDSVLMIPKGLHLEIAKRKWYQFNIINIDDGHFIEVLIQDKWNVRTDASIILNFNLILFMASQKQFSSVTWNLKIQCVFLDKEQALSEIGTLYTIPTHCTHTSEISRIKSGNHSRYLRSRQYTLNAVLVRKLLETKERE